MVTMHSSKPGSTGKNGHGFALGAYRVSRFRVRVIGFAGFILSNRRL